MMTLMTGRLMTLMTGARALLMRSRTHPPCTLTPQFTAGRYEFVTTLVGISVRGEPAVGVISEPYARQGAGRLLWGGQAAGGVYEWAAPGDATHKLRSPAADSLAARFAAVTSLSRSSGAVDEALTVLEAAGLVRERIPAGGAGFKAACCIDGRAAFWLFPRAGTSRWDTCAAQALLEAVGGALVDRAGRRIVYDHSASDHGNYDGVVAVRDRATLAAVVAVTAGEPPRS
jgi:3'(2'), 5'-bisphosphate nucleotidase